MTADPSLLLSGFYAGHGAYHIAFLAFSAFIGGLARGFSGFGAALIFMPLASAVIGPQLAAALLFVCDALMSPPMIPGAYRRAEKRQVAVMFTGAIFGVPLGTALLRYADPLALRWGIVVLVFLLLALLVSGWRYRGRPSPPATVAVGALSGLFAGAAQVGGPPVIAYWLGGTHPAAFVRANIVLYFAAGSVLTGVNYWLVGILSLEAAALALVVAPAFGAGLFLGSHGFGRASERVFRRICHGLIATAAVIGLPILDPWLR